MPDNLLIVDDEEDFCRLLSKNLSREGYSAYWTTNPAAVIGLLEKVKPACVLLDLKLATTDGLTVLQEIRKNDRHLPVIILTAFESIQTAVQAIQQGAFHYLSKPIKEKDLKPILKKAIRQRKLHHKIPDLRKALDGILTPDDFVGFSKEIQKIIKVEFQDEDSVSSVPVGSPSMSPETIVLPSTSSLPQITQEATRQIERKMIVEALSECQWHQGKTAQKLGIDPKTLYSKMKEYKIQKS